MSQGCHRGVTGVSQGCHRVDFGGSFGGGVLEIGSGAAFKGGRWSGGTQGRQIWGQILIENRSIFDVFDDFGSIFDHGRFGGGFWVVESFEGLIEGG